MKLQKKSVEVEAVLFDKTNTPKGVLFKGYDPATEEFEQAYVKTPVGDLPINYGDYVVYENDKAYPCTPEAMAQNFTELVEKVDNQQIDFEFDGVKQGHLCLSDEGCLIFSGSKKKSAEDFMKYLQDKLIDPYIERVTKQVKVQKAFDIIDKQEIGTKNYFLNEAGRALCLHCDKKGSSFMLLRNNHKDKRLFICEECVAKYLLAVKERKNG